MPYTTDGIGWQGTDTSYEAAQDIAPKVATIRAQVLEYLRLNPGGLTTEELASLIGKPYRSVQPRLSELRDDGKIVDGGARRLGQYGKQICVWRHKDHAAQQ